MAQVLVGFVATLQEVGVRQRAGKSQVDVNKEMKSQVVEGVWVM